jgi:hypothetical protein
MRRRIERVVDEHHVRSTDLRELRDVVGLRGDVEVVAVDRSEVARRLVGGVHHVVAAVGDEARTGEQRSQPIQRPRGPAPGSCRPTPGRTPVGSPPGARAGWSRGNPGPAGSGGRHRRADRSDRGRPGDPRTAGSSKG